VPEKRQTGHQYSISDRAGSLPGLLSKNINAQLEIAPAAQIIVDKSRGCL
jgi:hypothetical protein